MITLTLLGIIATAEILRLLLVYKKISKKTHFKQKYEGTQKMIWDLEFKIFKTREIREEIRKEYDFMQARIEASKKQIADSITAEPERKRIEDQLVLAERDAGRFLEQIKALDLEISGSKPTDQYPNGVTGITNQIDSLRELQEMLNEWIKKL